MKCRHFKATFLTDEAAANLQLPPRKYSLPNVSHRLTGQYSMAEIFELMINTQSLTTKQFILNDQRASFFAGQVYYSMELQDKIEITPEDSA